MRTREIVLALAPWLIAPVASAGTPVLDATGIASMRDRGIFGPEAKKCPGAGDLKFFPVGFSRKGAFAYITHTDEDALMLWTFVVVDLVKDKRLERITMEDPDGEHNLEKFLATKGKEIVKVLGKNRIQDKDPGKPGAWPLTHKGTRLELFFRRQEDGDDSLHQMNLVAKGKGQKKIATIAAAGRDTCCRSPGYYRSPFENRIAILVLRGARGYEGDVVCRVDIVGAHLDSRFK